MTAREPCGCKHDGRKWLELCPTHREEFDARHEMAHAEHLARQPEGTYTYEAAPGVAPCAQTQAGSHHCTCGQYAKPGCQARWKRDGTFAKV